LVCFPSCEIHLFQDCSPGLTKDVICDQTNKARLNSIKRALLNNPGDFLLSHTVTRAVPSAPAGLTSVFGMGTGVTLPTKSPENRFEISNLDLRFQKSS